MCIRRRPTAILAVLLAISTVGVLLAADNAPAGTAEAEDKTPVAAPDGKEHVCRFLGGVE
jgi:hypothetical protein